MKFHYHGQSDPNPYPETHESCQYIPILFPKDPV